MNAIMRLESDLKISFEQLNIKFQSMLNDKRDELEKIVKNIIDNFDFEKLLKYHIEAKIKESLEKAFDEIDLSENLKIKLWNEIEKKLNKL